jgi:hypothetical protein
MFRRIDWLAVGLIAMTIIASATQWARASCSGRCIAKTWDPWGAYIKGTNTRIDFTSGCIYRAWKEGTEPYAGPYNGCTNGVSYKGYEVRYVSYSHTCQAYASAGDLLYAADTPVGLAVDSGTWPCCQSTGTCYVNP